MLVLKCSGCIPGPTALLLCRQHVYLSMACRNPRRGLMCEPPSVKRIDLYCHSDLSLAGFIVAAAPHAHKKCQVRLLAVSLKLAMLC